MSKLSHAQQKTLLKIGEHTGPLTEEEAKKLYDARVVNNLLKKGVLENVDGFIVKRVREQQRLAPPANVDTTKIRKTIDLSQASKAQVRATTSKCLCGCGMPVYGRAKFKPGHDGRLRGKVLRLMKGEPAEFDVTNQETLTYLKGAHWITPEIWDALKEAYHA